MPSLLAPLGLLALAAWLLPLWLHLRRREDVQTRLFAAWRWVRTAPRRARCWRIERWGLLLLRLLLIALLALLLAEPVGTISGRASTHVLLAPGIAPAQALQAGAPRAATWHRWQPGTPLREADGAADPRAPSSGRISDLRQLDARLPANARLVVVVPDWFDGADGARATLVHTVEWRSAPGVPIALPAPPRTALPTLAIRATAGLRAEARYVAAAAQAWPAAATNAAAETTAVLPPDTAVPARVDVVAWFVPGPVPHALVARAERGAQVLLAAQATWPTPLTPLPTWRDAHGPWFATATVGRGRVLQFTRPLQAASAPGLLDADFAARLREQLQPAAPADTRVFAADYRPVQASAAQAARLQLPSRSPWSPWLALLVALVFLAERVLAERVLAPRVPQQAPQRGQAPA